MRATKIIGTIGPASRNVETLREMIEAGLDVARLNFAHGSVEQHRETVAMVREAALQAGRPTAVLQDVPGPKLRLGPIADDVAELTTGASVVLTADEVLGTSERLSVAWPGLAEIMGPGDICYLADGAIRLRVVSTTDTEVLAEVEVGGTVASRQGLNLPNVTLSLPAVSEQDLRLINAGIEMGVDLIALSFVRRREDLDPVRRLLAEHGSDAPLIAKFEKPQAAANAEEIVEAADGIMVARGDLGIELPIEEVPLVQKQLLRLAGQTGTPAITATQMLESMVHSTRPTRAEVSDVANAIFDGTDAVMLSQETAVGEHPVKAVAMMSAIAATTERELPYGRWLAERVRSSGDQTTALAAGAVAASYQLGLKALVVPTNTGRTAALIAAHRPRVPVLAVSPRREVVRRCNFIWGVRTEVMEEETSGIEALLDACAAAAKRAGLAGPGEMIGVTAGVPAGVATHTNLFKVHEVT